MAQPLAPVKCPICGKEFVPAHHSRMYCSRACFLEIRRKREKEAREKKRRQKLLERGFENGLRTCEHCGQQFEVPFRSQRRLCDECRNQRYQDKKQTMNASYKKPAIAENGKKVHLCCDCKKPCVDHRCPDCWRKLRRKGGYSEMSAGADFTGYAALVRTRGYSE